ncbi:MAG: type IV secretion system DNA-binding domain-containing protein [bacterium]|nr:type IV secretion system DNA-binding domain-containing protein [bacterium]
MNERRDNTVYFAKTNFRGSDRTFGIKSDDRFQHVYVIGQTGTGKSNLLKNMAWQDIANGEGLAIVDPHGGFVEDVLEAIPANRVKDVVYFNPVDMEYPIGFNVLEVTDPAYKHLVASDLMGIFTKIWANVWSARMEYILSNCILALLDTPGSTLLGISRILVDKSYREKVVSNIKDPVVRAFWTQEYEGYTDRLRSEAIVPIQNKVGQFLSSPIIRNIVGQSKSSINVGEIMNQRKILLVNVAKGRVGEDNARLLGAMMITKIQLAAMERVRLPETERKDFYLYVDEFQNFATDSFANILSEARKYRLSITLAHQYIGQLVTDTTTAVRDAVFGNVGTMITLRVGAADAEFLEKEFTPEFEIQDLVNLPNYHIYIKLMVNGVRSRPFSAMTTAAQPAEGENVSEEVVRDYTRKHYSRNRADVEKEVDEWAAPLAAGTLNSGGNKKPSYDRKPAEPRKESKETFMINCSNCGKISHINFKPDPRRPVYCEDCLKKAQRGELPKPTAKDTDEKEIVKKPPHPTPNKAPEIEAGEFVAKRVEHAPKVSLSDLKARRAPNVSGLKSALQKALGNNQQEKPLVRSFKNERRGEERPKKEITSERPGGMDPGQIVKF